MAPPRLALAVFSVLVLLGTGVRPAPVPSTRHSREVVARVAPRLERDLAVRGLRLGAPVFIRIFKEESQLELWMRGARGFELFRLYPICSASGELGPKLEEGDQQSPEGLYAVSPRQMNPASDYFLSFDLGYPNAYDRSHGRTGSALMVHGDCVSAGCYAMTDEGISEIYALTEAALRGGQRFFRVHAFPFRLSEANLARHARSPWQRFWLQLKPAYDYFEALREPPEVRVLDGRYRLVGPRPMPASQASAR